MNQRRMVLVDFYWTRDKDPRVPLGHASLLASLARLPAVDVVPLVWAVNDAQLDPRAVTRAILNATQGWTSSAVDVALGAYVWAEDLIQRVLRGLREGGFGGRVVLGGPQVSYHGPGLEALYPQADAFVRGYGEDALCALAVSTTPVPFRGVHWAGSEDRNLTTQVDLESLPSPWLERRIPLEGQTFVRWETQRGCPFRCAFCQHREPGARLKRRNLAYSRVMEEIDLFCAAGVQDIAVLDPIFNAGSHAVEVLERFADRGYRGKLSLQCRAEMVTEAFLDAAARLDVCLEFGLQTVHDDEGRAIDRRNHPDKVASALAGVRARGLRHEVSLIFGLPHQTVAAFRESVDWCLRQQVPVLKAFPLLLLRGTPLERDRERWGLKTSDDAMGTVVASESFSTHDWQEMARLSDALRRTEGRHPSSVEELEWVLEPTTGPEMARWAPESMGGAA